MLPLLLSILSLPATAVGHSVLFVGNSYTFFNDPNSVNDCYVQLLAEGKPAWELDVQRYSRGGAKLTDHLEDATSGSDLDTWLHDTDAWSWDLVMLQDQSQVPGFPDTESSWQASKDAAVELAGMIDAAGAETRLFMTWGYREGDMSNAWLYPDYSTMQELLAEGYHAYAAAIEAEGYSVEVVPVGRVWQAIHDDHLAAGEDPLDSGAMFSRLYAGDGSHPSVLGSFVAGMTFYTATTGQSPVGMEWAPDVISEHDRDVAQRAVERVMADLIGGGEDTGEAQAGGDSGNPQSGDDSGGAGNETVDTGQAQEGGDEATEPGQGLGSSKEQGCGCAMGVGGGSGLLALLIVAIRRRGVAER